MVVVVSFFSSVLLSMKLLISLDGNLPEKQIMIVQSVVIGFVTITVVNVSDTILMLESSLLTFMNDIDELFDFLVNHPTGNHLFALLLFFIFCVFL